jgi:hypothetical protein
MIQQPFRYHGSEDVVHVGDRVISEERLFGVVQSIVIPDSHMADLLQSPDGGVLIAMNEGGVMTLSLMQTSNKSDDPNWCAEWKALKFLYRGSAVELPHGLGTVAWPYENSP